MKIVEVIHIAHVSGMGDFIFLGMGDFIFLEIEDSISEDGR